jgi:hypothetical protein
MAPERVAPLPTAVGLLIVTSLVVHLWVAGPEEYTMVHVCGILVAIGGSGLGMVLIGIRRAAVLNGKIDQRRLAAWMGASAFVFLGVGVVTVYLGSDVVEPAELLEVFHVNGAVGLFVGLVMGVLEARGIDKAEAAAREAARADALQEERRRSEKLNDLLRHYVLNGVSVIDGYAATLADRGVEADAVDVIRDRADTMAVLIQNVNALSVDAHPGTDVQSIPLDGALDRAARGTPDDQVTILTPTDPVAVRATNSFEQAVRLLLKALDAVLDADGVVVIEARQDDEVVHVCVGGAPGSLSKPLRDSVFEPVTSGVGLELYLAAEFLEGYATLETVDDGADSGRVVFRIGLDRAE